MSKSRIFNFYHADIIAHNLPEHEVRFSLSALIGFIIIRVTIDKDPDIHTHQTRYNFYFECI